MRGWAGDIDSQTCLTIFLVGAVWAESARRTSSTVGDPHSRTLEDEPGGGVTDRGAADHMRAGLVRGAASILAF
jgi:hypothetical protein